MTVRQQIIKKVNEGQEQDVNPFTWRNIPFSLKIFWIDYFREQKQLKNS